MSNEIDPKGYIVCGCQGETFLGKLEPISSIDSNGTSVKPKVGYPISLFPCYKYVCNTLQLPQMDSMGRQVGVNIAMQEIVAAPCNTPTNVRVEVTPSWIADSSSPGFDKTIERLLKIVQDQQMAMRSAAAGIQPVRGRM